jgi:hypothetical protein
VQGRRRGSQQSRLVLAQIAVAGLELEESAREEKDPPEDVDQFVEQNVEERVGADRGRADRRLVVNDDIAIFVLNQSTFQTAILQQEISDANLKNFANIDREMANVYFKRLNGTMTFDSFYFKIIFFFI